MLKNRSIYRRAFFLLLTQALIALLAVVIVSAASEAPAQLSAPAAVAARDSLAVPDTLSAAADTPLPPRQPTVDTNLELSIVSSPWAMLDSNKPETEGPRVLVVEAVMTNTGAATATAPVITLDYNEDPINDWVLLPGEDPERKSTELAPGDAYHAYWFATYTTTRPIGHVYTVTASANNASQVSTSVNAYQPLSDTVTTVRALSGGSTRLQETTSDIIVGVVFTATVKWDLGTNFQGALLSPVGNLDFDPSSYRLVAAKVTFTDEADPLNPIVKDIVEDRLYFDTVPVGTTHAQGDFIFLALRSTENRVCPYTTPKYQDYKYDNGYCAPGLPITGTVTLSMAKQVSAATVQQGRRLTYTIAYTNTGTKPLGNVWIWDDIAPEIGSVITPTMDPPGDPSETTEQRAAWYVGGIAPAGESGSTGMFTFTIVVDGGGQDLADQTPIVNSAFFGIDPVELPANAALTSTITSTVQAPTVAVAKSDGLDLVRAGEALTYTLRITNSGSITATNVVVTDLLPSGVSPGGGSSQNFYPPPIPPSGGFAVIEIPVTVDAIVPDGSTLTNIMTATYQNEAGWTHSPQTATDETTASAPFWVLTKADEPDAVVAGTTLTYTLTYYHNGITPAQEVAITDTLPPEVTYNGVVSQPPGWDPPIYDSGPPATLTWYTPTLTAGANGSMVFTVTVNSDAGGLITNQATLTSTEPATHTLTTEDTTVTTAADLAVTKSDDPDPVIAGENLTYTLQVTNNGPSDASGVTLTDSLPSGVSFISATLDHGSFDDANMVWSIGVLTDSLSANLTLLLAVDSAVTSTLTNTAIVSGDQDDPVSQNNTVTETTSVNTSADLNIDKTVSPTLLPAGMTLTYTLDYANQGPSDAVSVQISDTMSAKVTFGGVVSTTPPLDAPQLDGNRLTWSLPGLTADASGTIVYTATASPAAIGIISNTVMITSPTPDSSPDNNEASAEALIGDPTRATIYGYVFEDTDGNGKWDAGEPPIAGVTITLNGTDTTTTDQDGLYLYIVANPGVYTIVETDPDGYFSTTPNERHVPVELGNSYRADFGDAPNDSPFAAIYGTVFEDLDGNGLWDGAEVGLEGVTVTLDGLTSTTTDQYGGYTFSTATEGVHTVVETDPEGYFSTTPNERHVPVELGNGYQVDFGDAPNDSPFAAIYGTVFEDLNGNGLWDDDEVGLEGVTVTLDTVTSTTTDQYGGYTLSTATEGVHTVVETDPEGYFSTTPNERHVPVELGNGYQVDFGDAPNDSPFAAIYGTVFEDLHNIGQWDDDEVGLEGVTVTLDGVASTTTDQYGSYTFSTATEGIHTVVETDPEGYFSTTPNEVRVGVTLGQGYQIDFGDAPNESPFAAIYGTVFEDTDSNGHWDDDELGIEAVTVTLSGDGSTTTSLYGSYSLSTATEGAHTVVETDPEGYMSTTDNSVPVDVLLGNGYRVDFGDVPFCTCDGDKYEEDDEPELAVELTVGVTQTHDFCDDATDWTYIAAQPGFVYTVTTHSWGQRADTVLHLYDSDGQTLLATSDDFEGTDDFSSYVTWQAPLSGSRNYHVLTTNRSGLIGCQTDYDIALTQKEMYYNLLPIVLRNYTAPDAAEQAMPSTEAGQDLVPIESEGSADPEPSFSPTGIITHTCPDIHEVDDTWELAKPIGDGELQVHSFDSNPVEWAADKDFVWFDIQAGRTITFTVPVITGTWEVELMLYDRNGDPMPETLSHTGQLEWEATTGGRYFLAVSPPKLAAIYGCADVAGYKLQAELQPRWYLYLPIVTRQFGP